MIGFIFGVIVLVYCLWELFVLLEAKYTARRVDTLETRVKIMEEQKDLDDINVRTDKNEKF